MHKAVEGVLAVLLAVGICGGVPALLLWGWARWFGRTQPRTVSVILSLIGFTLATTSGLLAVSSLVWAHAIGGFPYYDPRLLSVGSANETDQHPVWFPGITPAQRTTNITKDAYS